MKNRSRVLFLVCIFFYKSSLMYAFDMKSMFAGMGTEFGAAPLGFTYGFEVWNDASVPMYVEQQGIASFMGAFFPSIKGYYGHQTLASIFGDTGSGPYENKKQNDIAKVAQGGLLATGNTAIVSSLADTGDETSSSIGASAQGVYHNQRYYFKMFIGTTANAHTSAVYRQSLTELPLVKNDPNIYYYHIFTSGGFGKGKSKHEPDVEMMGYQNPTQLDDPNSKTKGNVVLSGQLSELNFSNSSGTDVQVSLMYGDDPYTFTLEKYSFNKLAVPTPKAAKPASNGVSVAAPVSPPTIAPEKENNVKIQAASSTDEETPAVDDTPAPPPLFSLRPNTLSFNDVAKPSTPFRSFKLPGKGFDGYTYTVEVFQDQDQPLNVGIQGLTPGNYDIAVTSRVRDLTPCPCTFWYQSFEQAGSVQGYSDLPGQIWVVYTGADSQFQSKVTPGQVVSWNLVRPLINQGDQFVYFVYVATTDDAVAQKFIAKIAAQTIGKNVMQQYQQAAQTPISFAPADQSLDIADKSTVVAAKPMTPDQEVATLMGSLNIANGAIEDTDQGIIGYIVGADIFTPLGLGFGRFYYVLAPSVLSTSTIVSLVSGCLDTSKVASFGDVKAAISATVTSWLAAYIKKPADMQKQVEQYLIQYGNTKVVAADGKSLTKFGQICLKSIISGSVSLKYPSMKLSTVTNQYVYDFGKSEPDKMPAEIMQLKPLQSA